MRHSSAIALLKSENVGEKPPKGNIILGVLGLLFIVGGYFISVGIENPIMALMAFFAAVLLVIVGTYLLMIAGSVMFCKLLQKPESVKLSKPQNDAQAPKRYQPRNYSC